MMQIAIDVLRAYEDASTAIGRLDATAKLAPAGLRELLVLRSIAAPTGAGYSSMIALVRADGEGGDALGRYAGAVRAGAARARGGALPSVASLHEAIGLPIPSGHHIALDELLRDAHERTPPVLKSALAVTLLHAPGNSEPLDAAAARLTALTVTLVLCVGGATTDAWLTLPGAGGDRSLPATLTALAREARAAERGIGAARARMDAQSQRVRDELGRAAFSALEVLVLLHDEIVITIPETARALGLTPPTAGAAVARLVELGIAREVTGRARSRAFACEEIVKDLAPA